MKLNKLQRLYLQAGKYKQECARLRLCLTLAPPGCDYHLSTNKKLKEAKRAYKRTLRLALEEAAKAPLHLMRDLYSARLYLIQGGCLFHDFYWGEWERYETLEEAVHAAEEIVFAYEKEQGIKDDETPYRLPKHR